MYAWRKIETLKKYVYNSVDEARIKTSYTVYLTLLTYAMLISSGNLLNRTLGLLKKNCNATIATDSIAIPEDNSMRVLAIESVSIFNYA